MSNVWHSGWNSELSFERTELESCSAMLNLGTFVLFVLLQVTGMDEYLALDSGLIFIQTVYEH